MSQSMLAHNTTSTQSGFTLVELMVAMVLGLFLLTGVLQIFISNKQSYRLQEGLSRVQESGRFSIGFLSDELRGVGYNGCGNLERTSLCVQANPPGANMSFDSSLIGYDGVVNGTGTNWVNPSAIVQVAGTDVFTVTGTSPRELHLTGNLGAVNANIQVYGDTVGINAGDQLMITDCTNTDIFRASSVSSSSGKVTMAHANNVNLTNNLCVAYQADAVVMQPISNTYFIGLNPAGMPALYRIDINNNVDELMDGVRDMQLLYGIDNVGNDRVIDQYLPATAIGTAPNTWARVLSVRLAVLLESAEPVLEDDESRTFNILGTVTTFNDRIMRQIFTSTVALRNRLP